MPRILNVFALWDTPTLFAKAIGQKPNTVHKWAKKGRIPEEAWESVIIAAALKGVELTVADIMQANRPMKRRGRPAHKNKNSRRRSDITLPA